MANSSIHIQKANGNCFKHNSREEKHQAETIHQEHSKKNTCEIDSQKAQENFDTLYHERIAKATSNRVAKKENCLVEAVVNIEPNTTKEQLKELSDYIEKEFKFKTLQTAIHKDEGHIKDDRLSVNYHAHIVFLSLDENGKQMNRREHIDRAKLSRLQDETAKILKMDRGQVNSEARRLSHKDFKEHQKRTEPLEEKIQHLENRHEKVLEMVIDSDKYNNDLINNLKLELSQSKEAQKSLKIGLNTQKEENNELREELKQNGATRSDFAIIEAENKKEKEKIKQELKKEKEKSSSIQKRLEHTQKSLKIATTKLDKFQPKDKGMSR